MSGDPRARYEQFASRREDAVRSPQGFVALVNTQWVTSEQEVWPVPGVWAPLPDGESGLLVRAEAGHEVTIDGEVVDGEAVVRGNDDPHPSQIRFSPEVTGSVISGESGYGLRIFDTSCDEASRFSHIDRYPYDPLWVVTARWQEIPGGARVGFHHLQDDGHTREEFVPGTIELRVDGEVFALSAFKAGKALQLVFADSTTGEETYGVGRFLFCAPQPDGTITLDFNYAIVPPCAFSYQYNCPLPPAQNRLPFAVRAGEKQVMAGPDTFLHPQ